MDTTSIDLIRALFEAFEGDFVERLLGLAEKEGDKPAAEKPSVNSMLRDPRVGAIYKRKFDKERKSPSTTAGSAAATARYAAGNAALVKRKHASSVNPGPYHKLAAHFHRKAADAHVAAGNQKRADKHTKLAAAHDERHKKYGDKAPENKVARSSYLSKERAS